MYEVVKMVFGSRLYGTNTPASDSDFKSVYIPDARDLYLGTVKQSFNKKTKYEREQVVSGMIAKNLSSDIDMEVVSLLHFLKNLSLGDTMMLDMVFAQERHLLVTSPIWDELILNRPKLLSCKTEQAVKYVNNQIKKYGTKGTRMAECRTLMNFFREKMEIKASTKVDKYDAEIRKLIEGALFSSIEPIKQADHTEVNHIVCCGKKIGYRISVKDAHEILKKMFDRHGQRTIMAESNEGVDWKAVSHAVRVPYEIIELFKTGHITFPRPEAEYLIKIKTGYLRFKDVAEHLEILSQDVIDAMEKSHLPKEADTQWIEDFVCRTYKFYS